ncbi:MAG: tetratricopeptide repeat protein [Pseudomonadales bacterium]|jgi:tetratricopeptide (TPR) repeat protein|nr:tetratricopeptide repeat protein [Pseudomonadales bacterium]
MALSRIVSSCFRPLTGALLALALLVAAPLVPAVVEAQAEAEATSLLGEPLLPTPLSAAARDRLETALAEARAAFDQDPNELNTIWLGRRLAYLQRYREAIAVYTDGIERFPESYRLHRHRGHRYISTRRFDDAIADFERAHALMPRGVTETEPDGIPNATNTPLSNTQFNILYHLGLAHYLKGDFAAAEGAYRECLTYSPNPDLLVATTDWLYMTLRRAGQPEAAAAVLAPITPELAVIENDAYLKRLRMYRGELDVEALFETDAADRALALATQGYGVANWYLYNGDRPRAEAIWDEIFATGSWAAFGYIAAEADRARLP